MWVPSPIGKASFPEENEFSVGSIGRSDFSIRSEDSFDRNWREGFYNNNKKSDDRISPKELVQISAETPCKETCTTYDLFCAFSVYPLTHKSRLQSEESLRAQIRQSVNAYDSSLVRKLNASTSDPASIQRSKLTPPRDFRPVTAGSDNGHPPLPSQWQIRKSSPRNLPSSTAVSPRAIDTPLERWAHSSNGGEPVSSRIGRIHDKIPPILTHPLTEFQNSGDTASLSSSHLTDGELPSADSWLRAHSGNSLLGAGSGYEEPRSLRGSYDSYDGDEDSQMEDTPPLHVSNKMRHLTLHTPPMSNATHPHSYHQRLGSKRRASSPPNEDQMAGNSEPNRKGLLLEGTGSDMYNSRRTPPVHPFRTSPSGKYHMPQSVTGSFTSASASSGTTMWSTSMGPLSAASSVTTMDRGSPVTAFSPLSDMDMVKDGSFRSISSAPSSRPGTRHRQTLPEISAVTRDSESLPMKLSPVPKISGMFICDCCPKKPKKFDNPEDMHLHESEKQYSCLYCNNRFKNKNEAERHQNSLHLRKHSWSCASLAGNYKSAFHQSPHRPTFADICGYCGKEFPLPARWDIRTDHLTAEHKFGECNQSKKFYRADHFRQHLKHSHSGTSGKWTNVLENACMRDEIPPTPINRGGIMNSSSIISEEISE
ncbi:hypothetical protein EDC01DRAFT_618478 [Geopyxis carbonaria]|nr:hypothetical protein EDC01DRAFT_618478 [Geopyxis carbonaria]